MRLPATKALPALFVLGLSWLSAQQIQSNRAVTTVPRLVRFSDTFHPASALPAAPVESVTLLIYKDQEGGTPLWQEIQNITLDSENRYTVLIGSTLNEGMPLDLFNSAEPRWLAVRFNSPGETEQPRVQMVSVPYALRASDAEMLGGLPPTAYLRAPASSLTSSTTTAASPWAATTTNSAKLKPRATTGTTNCIAAFTDATDLGCSPMWQSGGNIGLGTTTPGSIFDMQNSAPGFANFLNMKSNFTGTGVAASGVTLSHQFSSMLMRAYSPGAPGSLQNSIGWFALSGSNKLLIGHAGSSVGNDLGFFTNNNWANPQFSLTYAGNVGIGTTSPATKLEVNGNAQVDGSLTVGGNILGPGSTGAVFQASPASTNLAAGVGAMPSTTGGQDTAVGDIALHANSTGSFNAAFGFGALRLNTTGGLNTAVGNAALFNNTNGANNTALGTDALLSNTTASNNTAVGELALYSNQTGVDNTAVGAQALTVTTGASNTAVGFMAAASLGFGSYNTGVGTFSLQHNLSGVDNTAVGM